ncbi:uncharacterized protein [Diadema antillarum]|uniref:uncharacterized protein n=1 Tax=Diadema antillarum TaxID=105358 RepID=UPI003A849669
MATLRTVLSLLSLCAVISGNYGLPLLSSPGNAAADVTEQKRAEMTTVIIPPSMTTTSLDRLVHPGPTERVEGEEMASPVRNTAPIDRIEGVGHDNGHYPVDEVVAEATNFRTLHSDDNDLQRDDGPASPAGYFPWWTVMIILIVTVVIIIAITVPFYFYNRHLNSRRTAAQETKRASDVVVDSWIATSHSSVPPFQSLTPDDSEADDDVSRAEFAVISEVPTTGESRENILG